MTAMNIVVQDGHYDLRKVEEHHFHCKGAMHGSPRVEQGDRWGRCPIADQPTWSSTTVSGETASRRLLLYKQPARKLNEQMLQPYVIRIHIQVRGVTHTIVHVLYRMVRFFVYPDSSLWSIILYGVYGTMYNILQMFSIPAVLMFLGIQRINGFSL